MQTLAFQTIPVWVKKIPDEKQDLFVCTIIPCAHIPHNAPWEPFACDGTFCRFHWYFMCMKHTHPCSFMQSKLCVFLKKRNQSSFLW